MRAIPYRNAEKNRPRTHRNPDPGLFGWFRRVASAVTEALKTVINTITTTLETAFRALQGFVGKIMEGVRLLAAGIMAVAGFIGKLFRDFLHMLMEFGQYVLGVIKKIVNVILRVLKFILWVISWIIVKGLEILVSFVLGVAKRGFGVGVARSLIIHASYGSLVFDVRAVERYIDEFGGELWCLRILVGYDVSVEGVDQSLGFNLTMVLPGIFVFSPHLFLDFYPTSEVGDSEGFKDTFDRVKERVAEIVSVVLSLASLTGVATAGAYTIWAVGKSKNYAALIATLGVVISSLFSNVKSIHDDIVGISREGDEHDKYIALALSILSLGVIVYLIYGVWKQILPSGYFWGNAQTVLKKRPFHKVMGILGGGPLITIAEFALRLFGVELDLSPVVKMLISRGFGYLVLCILNEAGKVKYGLRTGKIFWYPRHLRGRSGGRIGFYYMLLVGVFGVFGALWALRDVVLLL